jgi:WD40 repeat protein
MPESKSKSKTLIVTPADIIEIPNRPAPRVPDHELIRKIGSGAYGEVWLAKSVVGTYRAVKVVYRNSFEDDGPYEREYRGIQKFEPISRSNEGFVDILQIGRSDEHGHFYYVMELADDAAPLVAAEVTKLTSITGIDQSLLTSAATQEKYIPKTLQSEIKHHGRLPFEECLRFAMSLNLALGYLHRQGLIHRDIKPSNIIFIGGIPKLADIGLVTEVEHARTFVGTEGFIPPEGPNSPQADIYSLGKVLYEMSMGKDRTEFPEPFTALGQAAGSHELEELNAVILKACATNARDRYQSAEEMHVDLALLQNGKSVKSKRILERRLVFARRAGAAVGLIAALAIGGYLFQRHQTRQEQANSLRLQHNLAQQYLRKGQALCDAGDTVRGLHWFARAWNESPESSIALRSVIEANLGAWSRGLNTPAAILWDDSIINAAAYSPDGSRIVTANVYGTARLWSTDGEPLKTLSGHERGIYTVAFSRDGKSVLTGSDDKTVRLWSAQTGAALGSPLIHDGRVRAAVFSPDGKRVLIASRDSARLWSVETSEPIGLPLRHSATVNAVAFNAEGTRAVTGGADKFARVWSLTGNTSVALLTMAHEDHVEGAVFSPDGKRVITRTARGVHFWSVETGEPDGFSIQHGAGIRAWALSRDGKLLVTGGSDNAARLWSVETRRSLGSAMLHGDEVVSVAFSADGKLVLTGSWDKTARVWSAQTGVPLSLPMLHSETVNEVAFSPDSRRVLSTFYSERTVVWSLTLSVEAERLPLEREGQTLAFAFSPDGTRLASGEGSGTAMLLSAATGKRIGAAMSHSNRIWAVAFSPDGKLLLTGSGDKTARLWSGETGEPLGVEFRHESQIRAVAFHPSGEIVATGGFDNTARVWNVNNGQKIGAPLVHPNFVEDVVFSPDGGTLLTACSDGAARLWSVRTGKLLLPLMQHRGAVLSAAFTPDGTRVVTGGRDSVVRFWEAATGRATGPVLDHGEWTEDLCFASGGSQLWTMGPRTVFLWDPETGERIGPAIWKSNQHNLEDFHVSPDGTRIAVQSGILVQASSSDPTLSVERPELSVQAWTWTEMDDHGVVTWLDSATHRARSDQLRGRASVASQVHKVR